MPYPELTIIEPVVQETRYTPSSVAKLAGTSDHLVNKLLRGGYLDLTRDSVEAFVRAARVSAGGLLPVLKTDSPSPDGTWRPWSGDGLSLNNSEWLDAIRGDWHAVTVEKVLSAECLLGGLGGLVTGVAKVIDREDTGDNTKARFNAALIGRLVSNISSGEIYLNPAVSEEDRQFAKSVIGKRYEPERGGSVSYI